MSDRTSQTTSRGFAPNDQIVSERPNKMPSKETSFVVARLNMIDQDASAQQVPFSGANSGRPFLRLNWNPCTHETTIRQH